VEDAKDDGMAMLASATGGSFFHNNNDLALGFKRLAAVPDVLYVLGFYPGEVVADGGYHQLKVRLTSGHHGSIEASDGYYAPEKELPADQSRRLDRDRMLKGPDAQVVDAGRGVERERHGKIGRGQRFEAAIPESQIG
jgi:hypothetical protein